MFVVFCASNTVRSCSSDSQLVEDLNHWINKDSLLHPINPVLISNSVAPNFKTIFKLREIKFKHLFKLQISSSSIVNQNCDPVLTLNLRLNFQYLFFLFFFNELSKLIVCV